MNTIVRGDDYLNLPRAPETWLIEPLIPAGGTALLYGDPKVGKSYAALQLALSLQTGVDWLGFPSRSRSEGVYIQLDTPRSLWADRLDVLRKDGFPIDQLHLADRETLDCFPFDILNPTHATLLIHSLKEMNPYPGWVILDTIREAHSLDENNSTDMRNVMAALSGAVKPAALIIISHSKKPSEMGADLINDNRGSSYVSGRMDSIIRFTKKSIHYTGRAIEQGSLKLRRGETGMWELDTDEVDTAATSILLDPSFTSMRSRAAALSTRVGIKEEAARSILRRSAMRSTR